MEHKKIFRNTPDRRVFRNTITNSESTIQKKKKEYLISY